MTSGTQRLRWPSWQITTIGACATLAAIGLGWLVSGAPGSGTDYYFTFRPTALHWLDGSTRLFDAVSTGFYDPPWTIVPISLFAVLPYQIGLVLLLAVSLLIIGGAVFVFSSANQARPIALAFALFNLHMFDLLFRGQLSSFEVAGIALSWVAYRKKNPWLMGLAYFTLMLIPPNTIPIAVYMVWITRRDWSRKAWATSFIIPIGVVLASLIFFGWWPSRWLANNGAVPQQIFFLTTIWRMAGQLGLPIIIPIGITAGAIALAVWAWRRAGSRGGQESDLARLMLLIAVTLMITPYSLGYRLVPLLACVMPYLARWRRDVLIGLYALTFLPLARIFVGRDNSWIDILFVAAVFLATALYVGKSRTETASPQGVLANG